MSIDIPIQPLIQICAPLIATDTVTAIIATESGFNPYAIGIVNGSIAQPKNLTDALSTVSYLNEKHINYSVGLMQINQSNFERFGVTAKDMFDPCKNLQIAQKILASCYTRSDDLNKTFSCYYSGNDTRGFIKDIGNTSYVERIHLSSYKPVVPSIKLLLQSTTVTTSRSPHKADNINGTYMATFTKAPVGAPSTDVFNSY